MNLWYGLHQVGENLRLAAGVVEADSGQAW